MYHSIRVSTRLVQHDYQIFPPFDGGKLCRTATMTAFHPMPCMTQGSRLLAMQTQREGITGITGANMDLQFSFPQIPRTSPRISAAASISAGFFFFFFLSLAGRVKSRPGLLVLEALGLSLSPLACEPGPSPLACSS